MNNTNNIEKDTLELYSEQMHDTVSKNVQKFRKLRKMSQLELALAIGLRGAAYLGKAELRKNDHHFNIKHIAKISLVLDVDICEFFKK